MNEIEQRYIEYGCSDFRLHNLNDLKNIHFSVKDLQGYCELPQKQRELFDKVIIRFYNAQGLDTRNQLQPKNVHYVNEVEYINSNNEIVGEDIYIVESDGETVGKRLHRRKFYKNTDFKKCTASNKGCYLRFELKNEWYHFMPNGTWY